MSDRKIEISISPALEAAMPDLVSIWKSAVTDTRYFAEVPDAPSKGELERIAAERYDEMTIRPKLPRTEVMAMIAANLVDEANNTICEKVAAAVLAPKQKTMIDLITDVRAADKAYLDVAAGNETAAWRARQDARAALRSAIYENLGVNIDDLKELTRG